MYDINTSRISNEQGLAPQRSLYQQHMPAAGSGAHFIAKAFSAFSAETSHDAECSNNLASKHTYQRGSPPKKMASIQLVHLVEACNNVPPQPAMHMDENQRFSKAAPAGK
jgi:hypothetical protein